MGKKNKIIFVHPMNGELERNIESATALYKLEQVHPSGWELKNPKDIQFLNVEQKNDNLQNAKDADNGRSNTGGVKDAEAESKDKSSD